MANFISIILFVPVLLLVASFVVVKTLWEFRGVKLTICLGLYLYATCLACAGFYHLGQGSAYKQVSEITKTYNKLVLEYQSRADYCKKAEVFFKEHKKLRRLF